jgi:hypothetical protein
MEGDCTETRNQRGASQLFKCIKYVELDAIRWTKSVVDVWFLSPEHAAHGPESRGPRAVRSALACGVSLLAHSLCHYVRLATIYLL